MCHSSKETNGRIPEYHELHLTFFNMSYAGKTNVMVETRNTN